MQQPHRAHTTELWCIVCIVIVVGYSSPNVYLLLFCLYAGHNFFALKPFIKLPM